MGEIIRANNLDPDTISANHHDIIQITENLLFDARIDITDKDSIKVPISELSGLGAGISSLLPSLRKVTQTVTVDMDGLYRLASNNFLFVGEATSDWKDNDRSYERIKAILIDAKWLMKAGLHYNQQAVTELSQNY